jgi:phosphate:Na+ symporter
MRSDFGIIDCSHSSGITRIIVLGLLIWPILGFAASDVVEVTSVNWATMGMGLFGGLSLFLFGMEQMSQGLKAVAGEGLKTLLEKLTKNRLLGALTGAFVTAVLNSSSVTTVLVVGFVTAGIMTLSQSISVIMGANIGSTVTAQIIAFNVTQFALLPIAIGFAMLFTGKLDRTRQSGAMIMGIGLVFFGMGIMSESMVPLRTYGPFISLMEKLQEPLLGILVGAVFTGLVQSSAATTGLAIVMASEGLISLPAGIALAFGANIGTCVTALLAAVGKPREAVRAAVAHIVFNIAGLLIWVFFIDDLAAFVVSISPSSPHLEGAARAAAEVPRQIANAHTVFNVANTLIFISFTGVFARLIMWLVPDRPEPETIIVRPKFLDAALITAPALALERVRLEIGHLGEIVLEMLDRVPNAFTKLDLQVFEEIERMDDKVDVLEGEIIKYLSQVRKQALTDKESHDFQILMGATDHLESIGDTMETDVVELGRKKIAMNIPVSETMNQIGTELFSSVRKAVELAIRAVRDEDEVAAQEVVALKPIVDLKANEALSHQAKMLADERDRLEVFRFEMEAIDRMKRIYTLARRIAKLALPEAIAAQAA